MKQRLSTILLQSIPVLSFIGLIYIFTPEDLLAWEMLKRNPHELSNLFSYTLMFGCFYANYYWFTPRLYLTEKYLSFLGILLFLFGFIYVISNQINWPIILGESQNNLLPPPPHLLSQGPHRPPMGGHNPMNPPGIIFDFGKSVILYLLGILFTTLFRTRQFQYALTQAKTDAELKYLKAQIHPHFLFNSLNSVYAMCIEEEAPQSGKAVLQLSNMMRYVISDAHADLVDLEKEINYIKNYVALQELRLGDTAQIDFKIEGNSQSLKIAPLLLISIIENAFKYGISPEDDSPIKIHLSIQEQHLTLLVENKIHPNILPKESTGLGLQNTQQRLELNYPNKNCLIINNNSHLFSVSLSLELNK
ncbi:sensor histidine kinase [Flectobacillus roseus]|uniref:Histidine kinase n=1 Tax=Flectobacillus roseus TaxID=502259 RepID=A0ABT6Y5A0_9BACT|nr:histidine kinase [Flectobacillus roseus]MDI9858624.1 histidine kinase [Flectobacillus roseus]